MQTDLVSAAVRGTRKGLGKLLAAVHEIEPRIVTPAAGGERQVYAFANTTLHASEEIETRRQGSNSP